MMQQRDKQEGGCEPETSGLQYTHSESQQKARFPNPRVANKEEFEQVVTEKQDKEQK